jgi:hypothetical protein
MSVMPFPRSFSLLTPLLWGAAMFFLLLAARNILRSRSSSKRWDMDEIEWGGPQPNLLQRWTIKMGKIRFSLPGFVKQPRMPEIAPKPTPSTPANAPADPLKKPTQPMLALFGSTIGAPDTKPKDAFAWEETKEIE